jgi:hypothetical protein
MPEFSFAVTGVAPVPFAAVPQLAFDLAIASDAPVRNLALQVQVQLEPVRRRYTPDEQRRLVDLFGEPSRWGETLQTMLWTHVALHVAAFDARTVAQILVPCTFDFNVATTKYLHGLEAGDVPLRFLFSGSVFYEADGRLQMTQLSWSSEATFRLPVSVWRELMDQHYPGSAFLHVRRDVFDRLLQYKAEGGFATWEQTFERLLT